MDKLPDILDEEQKKNKVKNNLQVIRKRGKILGFMKVSIAKKLIKGNKLKSFKVG